LALLLAPFNQIFSREPKPTVIFTSECSCEGDHAESRWQAKTDLAEPPADQSQIQRITPSEMYAWAGPGVPMTRKQDRIPAEQRWYAVTGSVVQIRAEEDADIHVILADATGEAPGNVVVEIPLEARWCPMRTTIFSWTNASFPFETRRGNDFGLLRAQIVTVIGKAFYDVDHSGKGTKNNRRNYDEKLAVWEIHPVMQIQLGAVSAGKTVPAVQPKAGPMPAVSVPLSQSPATLIPQSTHAPEQAITLIRPVMVALRYGQALLQPGIKLAVVERRGATVWVRYMDQTYPIPVSSTNLDHE
jgi:hypothetical protein